MAYRAGTKNYYRKFFKRYRFTYIFVILTIIANLGFWVYVRYLDGDSILEEFSYKKMVFASCLLMGSLLVDVIMSMYVQNRYEKAHLESDED